MTVWTTVRDESLEFFQLRRVEARLRARSVEQEALIVELTRASDERLRFIPGFASLGAAIVSATLLREALALLLRAHAVERAAAPDLDALDLVSELELMCSADSSAPPRWQRLTSLLTTNAALAFDRMAIEVLRADGAIFDATTRWVRARVDARSVDHVRWLRRGRYAAMSLIILIGAGTELHDAIATPNVALGKAVAMSSLASGSAPASALVDGVESGRHVGSKNADIVKTNPDVASSATIDLGQSYRIREVRVFNRDDDLFDDGLPYTVALSTDGVAFTPLGVRSTHFGSGLLDPAWSIDGGRISARYVRVHCEKYLALSEVEVFAK